MVGDRVRFLDKINMTLRLWLTFRSAKTLNSASCLSMLVLSFPTSTINKIICFWLDGHCTCTEFAWPLCWWQMHGYICCFSNWKLKVSNLEVGLFLIWILTNENLPYLVLKTFASLCERALLKKSDLSFLFLFLFFFLLTWDRSK